MRVEGSSDLAEMALCLDVGGEAGLDVVYGRLQTATGPGSRVQGSGFRIQGWRVQGWRVQGLGLRD